MNSIIGIPTMSNYYKYMSFNPLLISILIGVLIIYFIFFGTLGTSNLEGADYRSDSSFLKILGIIVASIFVVLILINGFMYFLDIDIVTSVKNFFSKRPEIDIIVDDEAGALPISSESAEEPIPEIERIKQVYHIPGNEYTYDDAGAICQAYGSKLADYKEIEKAYKDGGDWCSYGWSADQMAFFPTQYNKWDKLQKIKGHENDCGRPGINGGYIDNPNIKFGVNCYGHKPKMTQYEGELMQNQSLYPITKEEQKFEKRVTHWRNKLTDILVSPFNHNSWSR